LNELPYFGFFLGRSGWQRVALQNSLFQPKDPDWCSKRRVVGMRIFIQLVLAISGLVVVLVAGLTGLAQLKFMSFLSESVRERLEIITTTSAQDFGTAIDLGLTLPEVANGQAILNRARSHDPNIRSILVFDLEGSVLHASGDVTSDRVDHETFEAFQLAQTGLTGESWGTENDERIGSGILVVGSFGQPVGGIVVEYPTTEMREQAHTMARRLMLGGGRVAAVMSLIVLVMLALFRTRLFQLEAATLPIRSRPP
jgi:hypothetical protein